MYPYILCFCGRSHGDLYDLFQALKRKKYDEFYAANNIDPLMMNYSEDARIELRDVFDQLGIELQCCKTRFLSEVMFDGLLVGNTGLNSH